MIERSCNANERLDEETVVDSTEQAPVRTKVLANFTTSSSDIQTAIGKASIEMNLSTAVSTPAASAATHKRDGEAIVIFGKDKAVFLLHPLIHAY